MDETKDSGYRSIGRIPATWTVAKLKTHADLFGRIGWQGLTSDEYRDDGAWLITGTDFTDGGINWDSCVHISEERWREARQIQVNEGDLLITKDGTIGKLAIVKDAPGHVSLNSGLMRIVPSKHDYDSKYLYYILASNVFTEWFKDVTLGASTIQHLYQGDFKNFVFPMPPLAEQKQIVTYLNNHIGRMRHAESILESQISTLESYKRSAIHEAVTKGLDSNARMKDSGVEWIGKIPNSWSINKLKCCVYLRARLGWKGLTADEYVDEGYPMYSAFNFQDNELDTSFADYITKERYEESPEIMIADGDVLLVKDGAGYGKHAYVKDLPCPATVNGSIGVMTPDGTLLGAYLNYFLDTSFFEYQKRQLVTGMGVPHLTQHFLRNVLLLVPPVSEQQHIVDYLDTKCAAIDKTISIKREQLGTLSRGRQSLIYEYVTGKRRVGEED